MMLHLYFQLVNSSPVETECCYLYRCRKRQNGLFGLRESGWRIAGVGGLKMIIVDIWRVIISVNEGEDC